MSYITEIEWQGASTFEEIAVWFIDPMREFLEMFDEQFVEPQTMLFEEHKISPAEKRACFFYYEMKNKLNDLEKLLYRLGDDYNKTPILDKPETKPNELKQSLMKKFAAMMGVDPSQIRHSREYSVDQLKLMINFFKFLHKGESRHTDCIEDLLSAVSKESTDTGNAESAEDQQSHVSE